MFHEWKLNFEASLSASHPSAKSAEGWGTLSWAVVKGCHLSKLDLLPSLTGLGAYSLRLWALPCPAIDCYVPSGLSR